MGESSRRENTGASGGKPLLQDFSLAGQPGSVAIETGSRASKRERVRDEERCEGKESGWASVEAHRANTKQERDIMRHIIWRNLQVNKRYGSLPLISSWSRTALQRKRVIISWHTFICHSLKQHNSKSGFMGWNQQACFLY